jgi:hypothetical protein
VDETPAVAPVEGAAPSPREEGAGGSEPRGLERLARPSTEAAVLVLALLVAVRVGSTPLQDNSFLTHLATGRLILESGSVPGVDPYSWTAHGEPWTVQSWLASVIYAVAEEVGGLRGVRTVVAAVVVVLVVLLWKLTAGTQGLLARVVPMVLVTAVGLDQWVERPFMFGAVGLALVLLALEGRLDPRWLVPVLWVWANTHGSFPFAAGVVGLALVGRWLDERQRPELELRCLGWTVLGTVLAVVGPLGPRLLVFPFEMLQEREAFSRVREWQPLRFDDPFALLFGVQLVLTAVAVVRLRRWRATLPTLAFAGAALLSSRNVLQASIVFTPILAQGLSGLGRLDGRRRGPLARPVVHALAIVLVVSVVLAAGRPDTALEPYPREASAWMRSQGLLDTESRVISRDLVGNYHTFAYGPEEVRVAFDDRVDMYPIEVVRAYFELLDRDGDHAAVVASLEPTAILWDQDSPFGRWTQSSPGWTVVWRDDVWLVAVPTPGVGASEGVPPAVGG